MARLPLQARVLLGAAGLAVAAAVALMALRVGSAISFAEPRLVVTSGAEEEAVMSLFRAMTGEPYADPHRLPFSASYYNLLFYAVFGTIGRLSGVSAEWLTTVWRLTALAITLGWLGLSLAAMRVFAPADDGAAAWHNHLLAAFLAIGPLVGFWAVSLNPELAAAALSAASLLVLARFYDHRRWEAVLAAALLSLAAWSFKQSYLFAGLALGLFLLLRRDWWGVVAITLLHGLWLAAVLALGSEPFRQQLFSHAEIPWAWGQLSRNLLNLAVKTLPMVVGAAVLAVWTKVRRPEDTAGQVAVLGLLAALPAVPFSAKLGASENYFFLFSFFLAVASARAVAVLAARGWPRLPTLALAAAWFLETAACLAVIMGWQGTVSLEAMHRKYADQRACVADLPSPFYAADPYLALPWMHAGDPHMVPAYYYDAGRARGQWFENGGIGGMVATAAMAAVAVPHSDQPPVVDGTALSPLYTRVRTGCAGLDIWSPARDK